MEQNPGSESTSLVPHETTPDGVKALRSGRFDEAASWFERALANRPPGEAERDDLLHLGEARLGQRRHVEAEQIGRSLLSLNPGCPEARRLTGIAVAHQDRAEEALILLIKAPDRHDVHMSRARSLERIGRFVEAETEARNATSLWPEDPAAFTLLGSILSHQRRHTEALTAFGQALKLDPDHAPARLARARLRITLGDGRAWPDLDARLDIPGLRPGFLPSGPAWDGSSAVGRSLLLIAEEDPGDQILFARYAGAMKRAGARIVLACRPEMARLFERAEGVDRVVTDPSELNEPIDGYAYLMSLPARLDATTADVPRPPYLGVDPSAAARWAAELAELPGKKVAVHWGETGPTADRRSIPPERFAALADVTNIHLVSIQAARGSDGLGLEQFPITDLSAGLEHGTDALVETAALLTNVALVVTNDAPVAHLAGALGVPVWVALPVGPDWYWAGDRSDSPWYPTMTLFRQQHAGAWESVFHAMAEALWAGQQASDNGHAEDP